MKTLRLLVFDFARAALIAGCLLGTGIGSAQPMTFTHLAGSVGGAGWFDGTGSVARFFNPGGVAVDGLGNVYIADQYNHTIRKMTPSAEVTTLAGSAGNAGSADGTGSAARFYEPTDVAVDGSGNVYVADFRNNTIRKVTASGVVTTLAGLAESAGSADGTGNAARFYYPRGVAVDGAGNVYVADQRNHTIRKVTASGVVTTLAGLAGNAGSGDGTGSGARFNGPDGVAVDGPGNVYVADQSNHTIRKVTPLGAVTTLAGLAGNPGSADGIGSAARFLSPSGVAVDGSGNIYVTSSSTIRRVTASGVVTTLAGLAGSRGSADGTGSAAQFDSPNGVAVDGTGNVYVADQSNHTIRKVTASGVVTTLSGMAAAQGSGDGTGGGARFDFPSGVAADGAGNVYVADENNHTIRKVTASGVVTTLAGVAGSWGSADGTGSAARFLHPTGVAVDGSGNVYVADCGNHTIRKVTASGVVTTVAGLAGSWGSADGTGAAARFHEPTGVAVDGSGNVYVADYSNHTVRKVTASGVVTTLAGLAGSSGSTNGTGSAARFYNPFGVAADGSGKVYVADYANHTIRQVTASGGVTTLAGMAGAQGSADGTGSGARFRYPSGVAADGTGNVYVEDRSNHTIRKVTASGVVTTLAGLALSQGSADGTGNGARFDWPRGVAVDGTGSVYVADYVNVAIRKGYSSLLDVATIDNPSGPMGQARFLGSSPLTASSWLWEVVRRPVDSTAPVSSQTSAAPWFQPDRPGLYTFRLTATASNGQQSITTVDLTATCGAPTATVSGSTTICAGAGANVRVDLTGQAPWILTWSDGAVQSDINTTPAFRTVYPTITTTYSLTAVTGANCAGSTAGSATVTTLTTPAAPSITYTSGGSPSCPGASITLDAGAGYAGYSWSTGATTRTITVSPAVTTTYTASVRTGTCWSPAGSLTHYVDSPFGAATLSLLYGSSVMCSGTAGGRVAMSVAGGYLPLYRWGYRTVPGGTINWTTGYGSNADVDLQAASFPGTGTFFLVGQVLSQGSCAGSVISGEFAIVVKACTVPSDRLTFTHLAGSVGGLGWFDGTGSAARFYNPSGVAVDGAGNVYVADSDNYTIRKETPAGVVTTLAGLAGAGGNDDGTGSEARFLYPSGVAADGAGNVYVADQHAHTIRKVTSSGVVTTLAGLAGNSGSADGTGSGARFNYPSGVAVDGAGNVYVADQRNHTIRKVTSSGVVTTLAGLAGDSGSADGSGSGARFYFPSGVAVDGAGNVYVADYYNHTIRKVTASGVVTTLAGLAENTGSADGTGSGARFSYPTSVAVDGTGYVYVADRWNHTIRKVTASGVVTTLAGLAGNSGSADGTGSGARFYNPSGVAVDGLGNVYVADSINHTIRKLTASGVVTTLAGLAGTSGSADGMGSLARFYYPYGVAVDGAGNVYVADSFNHTIRKVTASGVVTMLAGLAGYSGSADGTGSGARFYNPSGVAVDGSGNLYVADYYNHTIRRVTSLGVVTTLAGLAGAYGSADGTGSGARFSDPSGVAVDGAGNVYVADYYNHTIRKVTASGVVTTLAGLAENSGSADGTGSGARFNYPSGVAVDAAGNVYVADQSNQTIRKVTASGVVTTLAGLAGNSGWTDGAGSAARFWAPNGVAVDGAGNVYVAEEIDTIRKVTASGVVTTLAGLAWWSGSTDGEGSAARFFHPMGVAVDGAGNVYVADSGNHSIRKGFAALLDTATIDSPTGPMGSYRYLGSSPQTASSWLWEVVRRPADSTAQLSSTTASSPSFRPDRDGLFTFRLTATAANGQQSITLVDLSVTCGTVPTPVVSSSANPSCPDTPITLDAGAGYTSYLWSTGATTRTITVAPTVTQSYLVIGYIGSCPSSQVAYLQQVLTTPNHPAPSSNSPICAGSTLALFAQTTSGATYSWTGPNGFTSVLRNPTIPSATMAAAGTYTVTVTAAGCSRSAPTTVVVSPIGAVAVSAPGYANPLAAGLTASVADAGSGATYTWAMTNGTISGGQGTRTLTFRTGAAGTTQVGITVTRPGGCVSTGQAQVTIVTAPVSNGPGSTLFLPMWEVTANGTTGGDIPAGGTDTVVTWANQSAGNVVTHVTLWNRRGTPVLAYNVPLRGGDAVQMSLRDALNGLLNVNPAVQQSDPRGDICRQPEWMRFSNPDPADQFASICFYNTPAYSGAFRNRVWDSLDDSVDDPVCGTPSDGVFQGPFRGSLTIDVVNYATNFFPSDVSSWTNDAIATVWPDGTVNVLQGSSTRSEDSVLVGGYPLEILRFDPTLSWSSAGSTFYSAFFTSLDTGFPVSGVPAGYAFQGDGRIPAFGQPGTIRLSANPTGGSATLPTTVTFEALVNPLGGACAGFACQLELVSGPPGGSATVSYGVATAGAFDGIARWIVQLPAGLTATEFWVTPSACTACATCTSNRVPWTFAAASSFYVLSPCRLYDTRESSGPSAAAPALAPGETRALSVGTRCGVPSSTARSLSVNQTVTGTTADGELVLYRGDLVETPITSNLSFRGGKTRANNGVLELSRSGDGTFKVHNRSAGPVHFILDVNGMFQ